jgi:thiol-disulfide isomerase/thioredoxin
MSPGRREALILGAAGIAAAAAGFLVGPALLRLGEGGEGEIPSAASFQDLAGKVRTLGEWRGKVLVCNFWATWCAPCREEIPLLVAASRKYGPSGVEIVGIAIDNGAKVGQFAASFKIPYPILLAEARGLSLMGQLGNSAGGLPYTVVADRKGKLIHRKLGAFKPAELDAVLDPLTKG